jgi:hypothetical protein
MSGAILLLRPYDVMPFTGTNVLIYCAAIHVVINVSLPPRHVSVVIPVRLHTSALRTASAHFAEFSLSQLIRATPTQFPAFPNQSQN